MKTKTFKPIAIGTDESEETRFKSNLRLKKRLINELYNYCSTFVEIEDKSILQANYYDKFILDFLDKYKNEFPPISVDKMLEQMEVNIRQIDNLCQQIEAIKIDLDTNLEAPIPDFNIYTESENQNKLFHTLQRLSKDLNSLKADFGIRLIGNGIVQGTSQALIYDWSKQQMKPNTRKILGNERG